jgi:uncharacterized protein YjbI with pentapeptide repeats
VKKQVAKPLDERKIPIRAQRVTKTPVAHQLVQLQQTVGNKVVRRMLNGEVKRKKSGKHKPIKTEGRPLSAESSKKAAKAYDLYVVKGGPWRDIDLIDADLRNYDLVAFQPAGLNLTGAILRGNDLSGLDLGKTSLSGADLTRAKLIGANLDDAYLDYAELRKANLSWATLRQADLGGAVLNGARLFGTDLRGANLLGAKLRGAKLFAARYDDNTIWPKNFRPEKRGAINTDRSSRKVGR